MKKPRLKRILAGLVQHLVAAGILSRRAKSLLFFIVIQFSFQVTSEQMILAGDWVLISAPSRRGGGRNRAYRALLIRRVLLAS